MKRLLFNTLTKAATLSLALLFVSSSAVSGVNLSPEIKHAASSEMLAQEYSAASHSLLPNGFHESSLLEIQRLECSLSRHTLPRYTAQYNWAWYADALDGSRSKIDLLQINNSLIIANLFSLAHTRIDIRYPIPPPRV